MSSMRVYVIQISIAGRSIEKRYPLETTLQDLVTEYIIAKNFDDVQGVLLIEQNTFDLNDYVVLQQWKKPTRDDLVAPLGRTFMAGSFRHMTNVDGTPDGESFGLGSSLENNGDVVEALQRCYGMIWYLAAYIALNELGREPTRGDILYYIDKAHTPENYRAGLTRGKSGS